MNVAMYHCPSAKSVTGPRSTLCCFWPRNAGRSAKPATGTVMMPPITPPRPSVAPSRNLLRGNARRLGAASPAARRPAARSSARAARAAPARRRRCAAQLGGRVARPEEAEDDGDRRAPIVEIQQRIDDRARRGATAMPIAKPIGQRVGGGRCGSSWGSGSSSSGFNPRPPGRQRRSSWRNEREVLPTPPFAHREPTRSRTRPSAGRRAPGSPGSSRSPRATAARPPPATSRSRRCRACRRRTGARARGRDGRAAPRRGSTSRFGSTFAPA